ncbi:MAG: CvpA family protein [Treponema sp.]|jgi:membrane protein required for colicin V production|nr:CvpA family protein [Treponema sp.]
MNNVVFLDLIFLILLVLMIIRGRVRGFLLEIFSWASLILGILVAVYFYKTVGALIREKYFPNLKALPDILAFVLLFIGVFLIMKMLQKILSDVVKGVKLGGVDKLLGTVFGFIEGMVLISLVLFILSIQPLFDVSAVLEESFFSKLILPLIERRPKVNLNDLKDSVTLLCISGGAKIV